MAAFLRRLAEYAARADERIYGPTVPDSPVFNTGNGVGVRGLSDQELRDFNESVLGEESAAEFRKLDWFDDLVKRSVEAVRKG